MGSEGCKIRMLFFPFMAHGHTLPMVDMAKLFAAHGVKATILTTPANAPFIRPSIDRFNSSGDHHPLDLRLIPFPSLEVGLPEGCENLSSLTAVEDKNKLFLACGMLKDPFVHVLEQLGPDCVVTDMFFPWTWNVASEHNTPRIVFHGISLFSLATYDSFCRYKTFETLPTDAEYFVIPGIPHRVEMLKSQIETFSDAETALMEIVNQITETDSRNYGTIVNSFHELESAYVDHYRRVIGRKAWLVGPLSLCNNNMVDRPGRGNEASIDHGVCLGWLDGKSPGSVIYVCFGSMVEFSPKQVREIALGLEASNHPFIWVVRNVHDGWVPEGFEERNRGKGLIIKGWAPQILILNHAAVGGFVTHCGWNSSLEGITAGLPLVTWPQFAEQFFNEKLIVNILKIGVAIGVKEYCVGGKESMELLEAAKVTEVVNRVMGGGEEAEKRRARARELGQKAKQAMDKGGSSYNDINNLIKELTDWKSANEGRSAPCLRGVPT